MKKVFIGIDPGVTGGISSIELDANGKTVIQVHKMPTDLWGIQDLLQHLFTEACGEYYAEDPPMVVLEQVHASQQMGVSSAFTFGKCVGILEGILVSLHAEVGFANQIYVTPQKWQATLNCRTGGDKKVSLKRAKELFPDTEGITIKTADSLLLAYYGYMKYGK